MNPRSNDLALPDGPGWVAQVSVSRLGLPTSYVCYFKGKTAFSGKLCDEPPTRNV
jgi:hypothetical protein